MTRDELLAKARSEGKEWDFPDLEAQKSGAWAAYLLGVILLLLVDVVNGLVLHNFNRGADFALCSMVFVLFLTKYLRLKKTHELFVTILWGLLALSMLIVWILQVCGVL